MRSISYSLAFAGLSSLLLLAFLSWWLHSVYQNKYAQLQQQLTLRLEMAANRVENDFFARALECPQVNAAGDTIIFIRTTDARPAFPSPRMIRTRPSIAGGPLPKGGFDTHIRIFRDSFPQPAPIATDSLADQLAALVAATPWHDYGPSPRLIDLQREPGFEYRLRSDTLHSAFIRSGIFVLALPAYSSLLLRRMAPELLFAGLLFACVMMAFYVGERSQRRQRELIAIKNDFINNTTHELKTPITTVGLALEALESFGADEDRNRRLEYLHISQHELQRLQLLVDRVLHLAKFEQGQLQLDRQVIALDALVERALAILRIQFERASARVSYHTEGSDFRVCGDSFHLTNVLFNLLDNAMKYSRGTPIIQLRLHTTAAGVELLVSDRGIGIPAVYRSRVFEKFFRIPQGDLHNTKGHGLGLSYVAHIVRESGGSIHLSAPPEGGTTFIIRLPKYPGL